MKKKVSTRMAFFVWTIALGRILTLDTLKKETLNSDGPVLHV
jgi:hypothetical protein